MLVVKARLYRFRGVRIHLRGDGQGRNNGEQYDWGRTSCPHPLVPIGEYGWGARLKVGEHQGSPTGKQPSMPCQVGCRLRR